MTTQSSTAKTLSKIQQQKTIKGVQKPRKNVVKNTLESPFALDWPVVSAENIGEIISLLEKSCSGLKKVTCKPPWKEVAKYKGAGRKAFLEKYRQNFQENLDPEVLNQNREREKSVSHLIFGYNAVMRALEKDNVVGILVKKNVEPLFLVKTFLPGCANKSIPLIPLDDLDSILKNEKTLALSHACMVLGLKPSVKDKSNRFHSLFAKMCEAVQVDTKNDSDEDLEENMDCSMKDPIIDDKEKNNTCTSSCYLTQEQIKSYHLKRADNSKRAFVPGGSQEQIIDALGFGSDFIEFRSTDMDVPFNTNKLQLFDRKTTKRSKVENKKSAKAPKIEPKDAEQQEVCCSDPEAMDINSMFFIDDTGHEEEPHVKEETMKKEDNTVDLVNTDNMKNNVEKKKSSGLPYMSAKTKRVKNNPNRKRKD